MNLKEEATMNENVPAKTPKAKIETIKTLLEKMKPNFAAVLPKHISSDRLLKLALSTASKNPLLLQCSPNSYLHCIMTCATLGLDPDGTMGSAYILPYRNAKKNLYEAQIIIGYRGLIELALRGGEISSIEAHVVNANDRFEFSFGMNPVLSHTPSLGEDPGAMIAAYAVARFKDGTYQYDVMTKKQIDLIRARSKSSMSGPWVTDYDEMAKKTVVKRLCKYLSLNPQLRDALAIDAQADNDEVQDYMGDVVSIDGEVVSEEDETTISNIAKTLNQNLESRTPKEDK